MLPATFANTSQNTRSFARRAMAATLALGLALPAAPALALDRHEQGIVAGALGMLFIQGMIQASKNPQQQPAQSAHPVEMPRKYIKSRPASVSAHRTPAAYAFSSYTMSERRAIQRSLARAGYYYGGIDGAFGPGTYNATMGYARAIKSVGAMNSQAGAYGVYDRLLYGR
ncbi:MAG: peptidoglycan-binding domain-containing protein [Cypionkella sp.]|nr:peptidoglycan-binding domain-containing protein [Cypionkella sp.]